MQKAKLIHGELNAVVGECVVSSEEAAEMKAKVANSGTHYRIETERMMTTKQLEIREIWEKLNEGRYQLDWLVQKSVDNQQLNAVAEKIDEAVYELLGIAEERND